VRVNVSQVQDFSRCRFRWWARWIRNRIPRYEGDALTAGKILHQIFEDNARGIAMEAATDRRLQDARREGASAKALAVIEDLAGGLPLWEEKFPATALLEVEEPFEWRDPEMLNVTWLGRPDKGVYMGGKVWHRQLKGLAAQKNFGTYLRLAKRSYHEHLYAEVLAAKYPQYPYGGTIFDLVRKLKYLTYAGKKNETRKTAAEMFFQQPVTFDLDSGLHRSVMMAMRLHVRDMRTALMHWEESQEIPAPCEELNGGFTGNTEDPYFLVLIGEKSLDDDRLFKDRVDLYAEPEAE
jgi:hypothetical protein